MSILNDDDIKIKALEEGRDITKKEVRSKFVKRLNTFVNQYQAKRPKIVPTACSDAEYAKLKSVPH